MTVRAAVILARLAHLAHVLAQLERLSLMTSEERDRDPLTLLAAERALQVAAEAVFDVGHHLLAGRGRRIPASYRDIVPALVNEGALPETLGRRLEGMAGLRNILVHDYAEVDPRRIWESIEQHLGDLNEVHRALSGIPELNRLP